MRPRREPPPLHALCAVLLAAALPACEHRVEEPVPEVRAPRPPPTPAAASPPAPALPARCVKPTPPQPKRALASPGPDPACPADPTGPLPLRKAKVIFPEATAPDLRVEVAEKNEERMRGLMFRRTMSDEAGMIFLFQERENHSFWMHNTCIPLDMLFIDADGTIVGIEENTPTMNDGSFEVGCPSLYVLEVNAGWTRRHGVTAGQKVKLEGI